MSHKEEEHLNTEAGFYDEDSSPAILMAVEDEEDLGDDISNAEQPLEHTGQDWQLIDHRSLSQCGSSPRSLSHMDLELAPEEELGSQPPEQQLSEGYESDPPGSPLELTADYSALPPVAGTGDPSQAVSETIEEDKEERLMEEGEEPDVSASDKGSVYTQGAAGFEMDRSEEGLLSSKTSFASISVPASPSATAASQLSAPGALSGDGSLDEEAALSDLEDLEGLQSELVSQISSEQHQQFPDAGVCSIVTGYPVGGSSFARAGSGEGRGSEMNLSRLSDELPSGISLGRSSSSSSSGRGSQFGVPASEGHWARWLRAVGSAQAGRVLKQMWGALQACVRRVGAAVPPKLAARMQSLLRLLDGRSYPVGARTGPRLLVSGLAAVSVMLLWTCAKNRSLSRALRARDAELQHHIITILDLNTKLTSGGSEIAITRLCTYRPSLSLSYSAF